MTNKDYELIAGAFRAGRLTDLQALDPVSFNKGFEAAAFELANRLGLDNSRFDRARFLTACGIETKDRT